MTSPESRSQYTLSDLLRVMQRLRDPDFGCPWDLAQTFDSIVAATLEECYELVDAIENQDYVHIQEELGDVLFQVVFYSQLGAESGRFNFDDVVHGLADKLIRRHPHVFREGDIEGYIEGRIEAPIDSEAKDVSSSAADVQRVKDSWETIKEGERHAREETGILGDIPVALPAISRAQKMQKRAARVNLDWRDVASVVNKVQEELDELRQSIADGCTDAQEDELGDLLFSCINLARHLKLDGETALRRANAKFSSRLQRAEQIALGEGSGLGQLHAEQLDVIWEQVKRSEN